MRVDGLEERLRRTMSERAQDAPTAEHFLQEHRPLRHRSAVPAVVGAVGAVVVAVAITIVATHTPSRPAAVTRPHPSVARPSTTAPSTVRTTPPRVAALSCPRTTRGENWVPAAPQGIDGTARLVPNRTPDGATVCAYDGRTKNALSGRRVVDSGLADLQTALTWMPKALPGQDEECVGVAGPEPGSYLIGLRYGPATVWVSASDDCTGASNGRFTTLSNLSAFAESAFTAGRWSGLDRPPCAPDGRLGQGQAMVPGDPVSLTICSSSGGTVAVHAGFQPLVRALNQQPTRISNDSCKGPAREFYELAFGYAVGPPVMVMVTPGCLPGIDNTSLQARDGTAVEPLIKELLGKH
jgi:hypothetical protein